ncbi:MAG: P-II family nitrogen regulator [Candidatus Manganitrophus sp.]|nr:MAG: P-II family nitrogen regulator [Candidatus Manganitrophus sp.]
MKMVQAMVRPEKEGEVIAGLEKAGFISLTRQAVFGRGRQRGIQVGPVRYEELPKVWLMLVVEAEEVDRVVDTIKIAARTGNPGDGKIFVSTLAEARSIHPPI